MRFPLFRFIVPEKLDLIEISNTFTSIFTLHVPELPLSKITTSEDPGTEAPDEPLDVLDQLPVLLQLPLPTQYLWAACIQLRFPHIMVKTIRAWIHQVYLDRTPELMKKEGK